MTQAQLLVGNPVQADGVGEQACTDACGWGALSGGIQSLVSLLLALLSLNVTLRARLSPRFLQASPSPCSQWLGWSPCLLAALRDVSDFRGAGGCSETLCPASLGCWVQSGAARAQDALRACDIPLSRLWALDHFYPH